MGTGRRLIASNSLIILIDFQTDLAMTVGSGNIRTLVARAVDLARLGKAFDIPTILTTIGAKSFGGPLFQELHAVFPDRKPVDRTTMGILEDHTILEEIRGSQRKKLIMAGLWTDFCIVLSARQALDAGYEVYVVADACGDVSIEAHHAAIRQMTRAGVVPMESFRVLRELQTPRIQGNVQSASNAGIRCDRCGSVMIYEKFYGTQESFWGWRCTICGEIIDPTISENRDEWKQTETLLKASKDEQESAR
jgi:nicotinamidase-related amidase